MDKSSLSPFFFDHPWPFKSKATNVAKCLTSLARVAKLIAECPAPWMQKNRAPSFPALKTEVPLIVKWIRLKGRRANRKTLTMRLDHNSYVHDLAESYSHGFYAKAASSSRWVTDDLHVEMIGIIVLVISWSFVHTNKVIFKWLNKLHIRSRLFKKIALVKLD